MAQSIRPLLMFDASAKEAVAFYLDLFPNSSIESMEEYAAGEPGAEGTIKRADISLNALGVILIDSPVKHSFSFTPSISLFVDFDTESELNNTFGRLSEGGEVLMPPGDYGFSAKFGWVNDKFGVSWQLNLP